MSSTTQSPPLPITLAEAQARGWERLDIVLVSGDGYVDHPSFGVALLARVLEAEGWRVGVLSQPDWRSAEAFRALGSPRLYFGVSAGNVDSMLAHYTPRRRRRKGDPFSPNGESGRRPDRATAVYAQRCREAFPGVPVIIGGVEASLRRLAHWDHWSRTIRPSVLLSSKADLLVYGMGESRVIEIARRLDAGRPIEDLRTIPGTCALLGRREASPPGAVELPDYETCRRDPALIADVTRTVAEEGHPAGSVLVQKHGDQLVVHQPPAPAPTSRELDRWLGGSFTRHEHPGIGGQVPALETVRWSITTHRGCFGGCSFCALTEHQGRDVVSRSRSSILDEIRELVGDPAFGGTITDLGGPSANMYGLSCGREDERRCQRRSCLHPKICRHLRTNPGPWLELLHAARSLPGVNLVRISSGVRMDLLLEHPPALEALLKFHVGGQLKIAPEHDAPTALRAMRKYPPGTLRRFLEAFREVSTRLGKDQYVVPYLMSGHPGTTLADMEALATELRALGLRPRQVQDFTPTPMTLSTAQHLSRRDPLTGREVATVRGDRARDDQRALLQWFLPEWRARAVSLRARLAGKPPASSRVRPKNRRKPKRGASRRR